MRVVGMWSNVWRIRETTMEGLYAPVGMTFAQRVCHEMIHCVGGHSEGNLARIE